METLAAELSRLQQSREVILYSNRQKDVHKCIFTMLILFPFLLLQNDEQYAASVNGYTTPQPLASPCKVVAVNTANSSFATAPSSARFAETSQELFPTETISAPVKRDGRLLSAQSYSAAARTITKVEEIKANEGAMDKLARIDEALVNNGPSEQVRALVYWNQDGELYMDPEYNDALIVFTYGGKKYKAFDDIDCPLKFVRYFICMLNPRADPIKGVEDAALQTGRWIHNMSETQCRESMFILKKRRFKMSKPYKIVNEKSLNPSAAKFTEKKALSLSDSFCRRLVHCLYPEEQWQGRQSST